MKGIPRDSAFPAATRRRQEESGSTQRTRGFQLFSPLLSPPTPPLFPLLTTVMQPSFKLFKILSRREPFEEAAAGLPVPVFLVARHSLYSPSSSFPSWSPMFGQASRHLSLSSPSCPGHLPSRGYCTASVADLPLSGLR